MRRLLLSSSEQIETQTDIPSVIPAPVKVGDRLGSITYTVNGKVVAYYPVFAAENVGKRNFMACLLYVMGQFL